MPGDSGTSPVRGAHLRGQHQLPVPKEGDIVSLIRDFVGNNVALLPRPEDMPEPFVKVSAYCRDGARGVEPELAPRWNRHFRAAVAGEKWL